MYYRHRSWLTALALLPLLGACASLRLRRQIEELPSAVQFDPEPIVGDPETTTPDARSYSHFLLGLEALRQGDLATARDHLRIVIQRNPGAREAREHLFQILLAESRVNEAMSLVTDATMLARVPGNQLATYGLLMAYQGNRELLASITAELSQRRSGTAHLLQTYAVLLSGDTAAAETALKSLSEDPQWSAWGRLYLGRLYEGQGRLERARDVYAAGLESESSAFTLLSMHLAAVQAALHDDAAAAATAARMRRTAPGGVEAMVLRVFTTMRAIAPADAARIDIRRPVAAGSAAHAAFPGTATDIALAGYQFLELGEVNVASSLLLLSSVLQPNLPLAQVILALISAEAEQTDQAMQRLERAMEGENPYRDDAINQYGQLLLQGRSITEAVTGLAELLEEGSHFSWHATLTGRMAGSAFGDRGAIDYLRQLERKNDQPEIRYQRAMRMELLGQRDEALELVRREVLPGVPDHAEALNYVGYTLADQNRELDQARQMIYRAAIAKPWSGHILDSLAWVEYRLGQAKAALSWMELALEYSAPDPILHEHMGDILLAMGRRDDAIEQYQTALGLEPEPKQVETLRGKIELARKGKST